MRRSRVRGSIFGIRKVNVPNLSGLNRSQAKTALEAVGLTWTESSSAIQNINLDQSIVSQEIANGTAVNIGSSIPFIYYVYVAPPPPPPPSAPPSQPYPNISSVSPYGAGAGQAWTQNQAYITWSGSGWGSYTVTASNGSSNNSPSSSGGPPVLLSGFSAGTSYSVTVTLYANANYSGASASANANFTTAAATTPPSGPPEAPPSIPSAYCSGGTLVNASVNGYTLVAGNDERECIGTTLRERGTLTYGNSSNNYITCYNQWYEYPNDAYCGYVAPPPAAPPAAPPSGCTPFSIVPGSVGPCQYNPIFGGGSQSVRYYNSDCTTYEDYQFCNNYTPPSGPPAGPPADPPAAPPADPPAFPPIDLPPLGPPIGKSVSVSTLVRTTSGLVRAENLNVGDVLLSADLEGFPYTPGEGVLQEALAWRSDDPNLNIVNTTIVEIIKRTGNKAVIINGDIFSQFHWILVRRDGVTQFVVSENVLEGVDYIFDIDSNAWEIVDLFEVIEVNHETISLNCEPYDMFFTEKMLTHDSFSI
jgi:hypothetical protein